MSDQQEDFHIDVGCYSPPTSTIATIIGANGAQPTGGHQNLDPQWVQPSSNHHDGASFDLPLGLETITSPIPTQTIHYPPQMEQLGDFDALVPLPEHLLDTMPNEITPLDPAPFLHDLQEDLVPLTTNPVPTSSTDITEGSSKTAPDMQKPQKPSTKKESCARTYHRQPQQKQNRTFLHPNPIKVRSKKNLKVCPAKKKAPSLLTKDTQTWVSKMTQSTQTLIDSESSFHNDDYSKIHTIMKKLDTSNPLYVAPPSQTFQVIQQRQGLLQALNIIHANINKKEATTTFAMFHRYPFPPYKQP